MRLIEWAFEQELGTPEKIVLVWLARNANAAGVGPMDRDALELATGYKKRSMQRLLKSLRDSQHLVEHGIWYAIGNAGSDEYPVASDDELAQLPDGAQLRGFCSTETIDADAIGEAIAAHLTDAAEYMADQLANFERRFAMQVERLALLHVEHQAAAPPPDPVIENPLYQELLDLGKTEAQAYALSQADLAMSEELADELPPASGGEYASDAGGRYERIVDILHGAQAGAFLDHDRRLKWYRLETDENKHTKDGEPEAFELLYPAIVAAAKANVGKVSIDEFIEPNIQPRPGFKGSVTHGVYLWDQEINPLDKDDPAMMAEIAVMLSELEQANDPRCEVHARTVEEGDDGVTRTETVLGYYRRVQAKHSEMLKLKQMEIL